MPKKRGIIHYINLDILMSRFRNEKKRHWLTKKTTLHTCDDRAMFNKETKSMIQTNPSPKQCKQSTMHAVNIHPPTT